MSTSIEGRLHTRPRAAALLALAAGLTVMLAGCAQPAAPVAAAGPAVVTPKPVAFDDAVLAAANAVFSNGAKAQPAGQRPILVIDPLVDGVTGDQSVATRDIGNRIAALAREKYPQFDVRPFSAATVGQATLVIVGTFTPVNGQNQTAGTREAYRFCLVMADLKSGRTVAKSVVWARPAGFDTTSTEFFRDSPGWTEDAQIKSYVVTCQSTKVGDPIAPAYLNGIVTAATVSQAIDAYNAGHYREAMDLYQTAQTMPAGEQLRVYNGIYLSNLKLGRAAEADAAFGRLVDYGLKTNRLGMKLLFRPASTAFIPAEQGSGQYPAWLRTIASRGAASTACLQVTGNTSASGSPALNERLSVLRAERVKELLEGDAPSLHGRVIAAGAGAQKALVGTGADNATDVLDRRVEFQVIPQC